MYLSTLSLLMKMMSAITFVTLDSLNWDTYESIKEKHQKGKFIARSYNIQQANKRRCFFFNSLI